MRVVGAPHRQAGARARASALRLQHALGRRGRRGLLGNGCRRSGRRRLGRARLRRLIRLQGLHHSTITLRAQAWTEGQQAPSRSRKKMRRSPSRQPRAHVLLSSTCAEKVPGCKQWHGCIGALVQAGNPQTTRQTVSSRPLSHRHAGDGCLAGVAAVDSALNECLMQMTSGAGTAAYAASCSWRSRSRAAAASLRAVRRRSCSRLMRRASKLSGGPVDMPFTPHDHHVAVCGGAISNGRATRRCVQQDTHTARTACWPCMWHFPYDYKYGSVRAEHLILSCFPACSASEYCAHSHDVH